jgi:hypothetical protein
MASMILPHKSQVELEASLDRERRLPVTFWEDAPPQVDLPTYAVLSDLPTEGFRL